MSEDKIELTEDQWKEEINTAFNAGLSMARTIEYHLVMDERQAVVKWLRKCSETYSGIHDVPISSTAADLYATLIERGEHSK